MLYALLKTLHLLGVLLWVGGMLFAHFFLRPALAVLAPPQRLALMREVLRRFFAAVAVAVLVVLASGLAMLQLALRAPGFAWPADWLAMTALGLVMMVIFAGIRLGPYRRLVAALQAGEQPAAAAALARIRVWVGVNLALGLAVVSFVLLV
ncbi:MAG: CopD family protein [Rubrivivax sp.]